MRNLLIGCLLLASSTGFAAEPALISMVASNAVDQELPIGVFEGKPFQALPDARFVKLHMYPDKPMTGVSYIEIEACKQWDKVKAETVTQFGFLNFDELTSNEHEYDDGPFLRLNVTSPKILKVSAVDSGEAPVATIPDIESLTINFGPFKNICIQSVKFFDTKGKQIPVQAPMAASGSVKASSVQAPAQAYAAENMFDSKFENAWATDKVNNGAVLTFKFDSVTKIEKLKIWNGYQRSVTHCQQNSRVKSLEIKGDNGYSATIPIKDSLGSQEIVLPKPFSGQNLTVTVKDSVKGKSYQDLAITELRFFDGKNWFLLNPISHIKQINQEIREQFTKAKIAEMLNDEYTSDVMAETNRWSVRLRSDGSMFIQAYITEGEEGASYSALGNFEVKSVSTESIQLRIFGFLYKSNFGMDCNGCGVACNSPDKQDGSSEKIFQQTITLKPVMKKGKLESVEITNDSKKAKLNFKKITIQKRGDI